MEIDIGRIIEVGVLVVGCVSVYAVNNYKTENHSKLIGRLFEWKDNHDKEASQERLNLYQKIAEQKGAMDAKSKNDEAIMEKLQSIEEHIGNMQQDIAEFKAERRLRPRDA